MYYTFGYLLPNNSNSKCDISPFFKLKFEDNNYF